MMHPDHYAIVIITLMAGVAALIGERLIKVLYLFYWLGASFR
jgi:hypothetical protein